MIQKYHLAQINIAKGLSKLDDPVMKGFVDQLDRINALADSSPGFIWRLQTEGGDATSIHAFGDEKIIVNMSVWESFQSLRDYVYSGAHLEALKNKKYWFEKIQGPVLALWWIPAGSIPSVEDGKNALEQLKNFGSTSRAFTFAKPQKVPTENLSNKSLNKSLCMSKT